MPYRPKPIEYYIDENGCYIRTSPKSERKFLNGKSVPILQYVYLTEVGEIPEGKIVYHKCGNKKCVNPDHLYLTTRAEIAVQVSKKYVKHPITFEVDPVTGCHNCTSHAANEDGYHSMRVGDKFYLVHRFVYEQRYGKIPPGLKVCHKCDNPHCINIDHLELGTQDDNMKQMAERGRSLKGSKNKNAKLTEDDVREIKRRLAAGEGVNHLARVYGVSSQAISGIKTGKYWTHVTID